MPGRSVDALAAAEESLALILARCEAAPTQKLPQGPSPTLNRKRRLSSSTVGLSLLRAALRNQAKTNAQSRLAFAKPLSLEVNTSAQVLSQKVRCKDASEKRSRA